MTNKNSKFSKIPIIIIGVLLAISIVLFLKYMTIKETNKDYETALHNLEDVNDDYKSKMSDLKESSLLSVEDLNNQMTDLSTELDMVNESISEKQVALRKAKDDLVPYTRLLTSLDLDDDQLIYPNVTATMNGCKIVPVLKNTTDFIDEYLFNFRMVKESLDTIIYTYDNYDTYNVHIGSMNKKDLSVINEVIVESSPARNAQSLSHSVRAVDNGIAVLLSQSIKIYDDDLNLIQTIDLPSAMLEHFSSTRTRALDGRESINLYDVSHDLKLLTFGDENGVYLYNRLSKIKSKIMTYEEYEYIDESGQLTTSRKTPLHPMFSDGYIIAELHSGYIGYSKFMVYDLTNKTVMTKEIDGEDYGYRRSLGSYFTISSSNTYFENNFPDDDDFYKQTIIYKIKNDQLLIHPIRHSWTNFYLPLCFDGISGSVSLVSPSGIKNNDQDLDTEELIAYYYDYIQEDYLDKSITIKTKDPLTQSNLDTKILGLLEDNTAIYFIRINNQDYIFRF